MYEKPATAGIATLAQHVQTAKEAGKRLLFPSYAAAKQKLVAWVRGCVCVMWAWYGCVTIGDN